MRLEALGVLANDPLKLNNAKNTELFNLNTILYHAFLLNIYECLIYY